MKNFLTVTGLLLALAGAVAGSLVGFEAGKLTAFAVTMFGAGLAVANLWKERRERSEPWLCVLAMFLTGAGAMVAGFTGVLSESQLTTVMGHAFSILLIVSGLLASLIQKKSD